MGLFDNIREDILEMFGDYIVGTYDNPANRKIASQILNTFDKKNKSSRLWIRRDGLLKLCDKQLISVSGRGGVFYKRAGQIVTAYELLKTGLYSGRQVSKLCSVNIFTVCKLMRLDEDLKCLCGKSLKDHRGWCKIRYSKSEKRQKYISEKGFNKRGKYVSDPKELDSLVPNGSMLTFINRTKYGKAIYSCICGNSIEHSMYQVKSGHKKTCGCWNYKNNNRQKKVTPHDTQ